MKLKYLAAKIALVLSLSGPMITPVQAGIPVIDGANLGQNLMNTIETIAQTLKQIQQYQTQLEQYENQLKNTIAPAMYIWDKANSIINKLMTATDTLAYYKQRLGSIDQYLSKFQDVNYYRSSPCFALTGCSETEWAAISEIRRLASESQKRANDALFLGLDQQQDSLKADARTLERLQSSAQSATGRLQAIQYANQLSSQQANQLLQIRGLLIAQQNAVTTRNQALADREAQEAAAGNLLRTSVYKPSTGRTW